MKQLLPTITEWIARLAAAGILLQTLFFKFTAAPESVYIFETIGLEPLGRIGSGIVELVAALLLLMPRKQLAALGGLIGAGTMAGAIFFHLTKLGIEVQNDGGTLFAMALIVLASSAFVAFRNARSLLSLLRLPTSRATPLAAE